MKKYVFAGLGIILLILIPLVGYGLVKQGLLLDLAIFIVATAFIAYLCFMAATGKKELPKPVMIPVVTLGLVGMISTFVGFFVQSPWIPLIVFGAIVLGWLGFIFYCGLSTKSRSDDEV